MKGMEETGGEQCLLSALLRLVQEPLVLLDSSRRCVAVSRGFLSSFAPELQNEAGGGSSERRQEAPLPAELELQLEQVWPTFSSVALEEGEFELELFIGPEAKPVRCTCHHVSGELYLFAFNERDDSAQFFHQQRIQTLGLLAGGVAHDFNNVLAGILGHVTFLQAVLPPEGAHKESLDAITNGAKKASTLTRQILDFSKYDLAEEDPVVDLVELVSSTAPLLRGALTSAVELELQLPEEPAIVKGSEGKIAQILVNLVINARDAMERGGKVVVRVLPSHAFFSARPGYPLPIGVEPPFVLLEVEDNGMGMTDHVRSRALEPYFSTKGDRGTGLGLATVASITESFGGVVQIRSALGEGTTIQIFLRSAESHEQANAGGPSSVSEAAPHEQLARGKEHVLVVDDEHAVRSVVAMSLRHLGYSVTECGDPREALKLLKNLENPFDLVVLDMMMPFMPGDLLFFEMRLVRPTLPAVIMSGFSEEESIDRVLAAPLSQFIHKPFTVDELSQVVRDVLDMKASFT